MKPIHECLSDAPCTIIFTSHWSSEEEPPSPVNLILNLDVQSQQILGNLDPVVVGIRDVVHVAQHWFTGLLGRTGQPGHQPHLVAASAWSRNGQFRVRYQWGGVGGRASDGRRRPSPPICIESEISGETKQ